MGNDNYDIIFEKNIDGELIMKVYKLFNSFLEETERIEDEVSNRIICFLQSNENFVRNINRNWGSQRI